MQIVKKDAIFSHDKKYRYLLERELETGSKNICFIMLNPSVADNNQDDPTIRRVISFSSRFGAKKIWVVNLFALITPNPNILKKSEDPIGADNDEYIKKYISLSDMVILAWGSNGKLLNRDQEVLEMLKKFKDKVYALKILKDGSPSHPLYLKKDLEPIRYFK